MLQHMGRGDTMDMGVIGFSGIDLSEGEKQLSV